MGELELLVSQLQKDKLRLNKEIDDLTARNKKLKSDFDKTLSKEKLQELVKDYPVKIHEERDELLEKVEQLTEEKREMEQELDDLRSKVLKPKGKEAEFYQDTIELMKKENEELKKQVAGDASTKDTRDFIQKLKDNNKKSIDELELLVSQLQKDKLRLNKEIDDLTARNKKLKSDF